MGFSLQAICLWLLGPLLWLHDAHRAVAVAGDVIWQGEPSPVVQGDALILHNS